MLRSGSQKALGPALALCLCLATGARAQHAPIPGSPESTRPEAPLPSEPEAGQRLFGVEPADALIGVDDELAIRRLGGLDTDAALGALARVASDPGNLSDRALVLLTRALSSRASEPLAVRALSTILTRANNEAGTPRQSKLLTMAREQAALALALGGSEEALGVLARMVKRGHEDGELAARALAAHPPRRIGPLLDSPGVANVAFVAMLEALGDQRAFVPLREFVRRGTPAVQARAALALTRLGHLETVELARHWLRHSQHSEQQRAATEILLQTDDPGAPEAWTRLYDSAPLEAVSLALALPNPRLAEPIATRLGGVHDERLLTALGHAGGERAVALLEERIASPVGASAVYALARCPDERAGAALSRALESEHEAVLELASLGSVVRALSYGESTTAGRVAKALGESKSPSAMWTRVWVRSALDEDYAMAQLESPSLRVLGAAMATAAAQPREFFGRAAQLLASERNPRRRELLGLALLHPRARDEVSSHQLREWIDRNSPLRDLAILTLAERDDSRDVARVRALLGSTDLTTRTSTALGLARHRSPAATGLLAEAYQFEEEADVRLAVVMALSERAPAPVRHAVLVAARDVDVDGRVRAAARRALAGQALSPSVVGSETAWVTIPEGPVPEWLLLSGPALPSVPVPTSGQRVLPLLGLYSAAVAPRLAPASAPRDDALRDPSKAETR